MFPEQAETGILKANAHSLVDCRGHHAPGGSPADRCGFHTPALGHTGARKSMDAPLSRETVPPENRAIISGVLQMQASAHPASLCSGCSCVDCGNGYLSSQIPDLTLCVLLRLSEQRNMSKIVLVFLTVNKGYVKGHASIPCSEQRSSQRPR